MKRKFGRGNILVGIVITLAIGIMVIAALVPVLAGMGARTSISTALEYLARYGYTAYADSADILHAKGLSLSGDPPITLTGDAKVWIELRSDLNPTKLAVNSKPTAVERGIALGYGLPIGGADEELFYSICIPGRWDEESDIHVHIHAWLDTTQDEETDAIKLQLDWEHAGIGDLLPDTNNVVVDEEVVGIVGQYKVVEFDFTIDYNIDIGDPIRGDDTLFFHLTRVASSHEIAGEPVIFHSGVIFQCDKLGNPTHG